MDLIGEGKALLAFHGALTAVKDLMKTETADVGGKYQYKFAPFGDVLDEIKRVIRLHGMEVTQEPTSRDSMFVVVTTLIHEDGSMIRFEPIALPMPREAQALGSAITYCKRYSLLSYFAISTEDDDGRAATVAAQTQPGRRTEAERMVREAMSQLPEDQRRRFTAAFKDHFRVTLSDLPAARHGEALQFLKAWSDQDVSVEHTAGEAPQVTQETHA